MQATAIAQPSTESPPPLRATLGTVLDMLGTLAAPHLVTNTILQTIEYYSLPLYIEAHQRKGIFHLAHPTQLTPTTCGYTIGLLNEYDGEYHQIATIERLEPQPLCQPITRLSYTHMAHVSSCAL